MIPIWKCNNFIMTSVEDKPIGHSGITLLNSMKSVLGQYGLLGGSIPCWSVMSISYATQKRIHMYIHN